jgi:hypothetical protein
MDPPHQSGGFWRGTKGRLVIAALILVIIATAVGVTVALVLGDETPQSDELNTDNTTMPTPESTIEPTPQPATLEPTPESTSDPTPASTSATNEYPPIPLAYCNNRTEPRVVVDVLNKSVCQGDVLEYPLNPSPADVVTVDLLLHSMEAYGVNVAMNLMDTTLNELAGDFVGAYDRELLQVEANSQQGECGVPANLEILGENNCCLYDLSVEFYERVNFNMAGTGFDNALMIASNDGTTSSSSCGSINYVNDCETSHFWMLQANEGDEIYVNSLVEVKDIFTQATWTFYSESQAELDSEGLVFDTGRQNIKAKFTASTTGTHYIRLSCLGTGSIYFYAVAFQVKRSS